MLEQINELIKKEKFKEAEEKLQEILNSKNSNSEEKCKAYYLIGYINTLSQNEEKKQYIAKRNLLENIRSDYPEPNAYILYSKIEKDKNVAINYLEDGLKKFNNNAMILQNLFKLVEDINKEQIIQRIDESGLIDYNLFISIIEYLVDKEKWDKVKEYSMNVIEHYKLSQYELNYIELVEVYANILGKTKYDSNVIINKLQHIIKTDLDNDLKYSPYIAIVYEYMKTKDIENANFYFDKIPIDNKLEDLFDGPWAIINIDFQQIYKKIFNYFITEYDNDLKRKDKAKTLYILYLYSPSEIYGIYRYSKKDLLTLSKIFKNAEFNMDVAVAIYYMKIHFGLYYEAFEIYLNILENVVDFTGYDLSPYEIFENDDKELLAKISKKTRTFLNESEGYLSYHKELKEFIKILVEELFKNRLFKEIINLIGNVSVKILNSLDITFNVAFAYAEINNDNEALKLYKNILSKNPNDAPSLNNISLLYENLDDLDKAFKYIKKAKEIKEDEINRNNYNRIKNKLDERDTRKKEQENLKIQSVCKNLNLDKMEEIGYNEKLKNKFENIFDNELKNILLRDLQECAYSVLLEQNKSAIIMSGSIIEAILIYTIKNNKIKEYDLIGLRNRKKSCIKNVDSMILDELLFVSHKLGFLSDTNYYLSHFSREYRNVIHPNKEIRNKMQINVENANLMWKILKEIIYELL